MNTSAAIADPLLRRAFGRRARPSDPPLSRVARPRTFYAALQDPRHLRLGDDPKQHEFVGGLHCLCRLFLQSLHRLKPYDHPDPSAHRVVSSPERRNRAEVLLQIPIFDRAHFSTKSDRHKQQLLATAECLLKQLEARRRCWEEQNSRPTTVQEFCWSHVVAAEEARGSEV